MYRNSARARAIRAAMEERGISVSGATLERWTTNDGLGPAGEDRPFDALVDHFAAVAALTGQGRSADQAADSLMARGIGTKRGRRRMAALALGPQADMVALPTTDDADDAEDTARKLEAQLDQPGPDAPPSETLALLMQGWTQAAEPPSPLHPDDDCSAAGLRHEVVTATVVASAGGSFYAAPELMAGVACPLPPPRTQ